MAGYGHWYRGEDGPEFREELVYCPYCGELVDGDTYQCDNIYCGGDEDTLCGECGRRPVEEGEDYCSQCLLELQREADAADRFDRERDDQYDLPSDYSGQYYDPPMRQY